jgi:ribonuclease I
MCTSKNCLKKIASWKDKNIFTVHGLWPSYVDSRKIGDCNTGTSIRVDANSNPVYQKMRTKWPSYTSSSDTDFWTHEYNKHGYCYTDKFNETDPADFFNYSMELYDTHSFENLFNNPDLPGPKEGEMVYTWQQLVDMVNISMPNMYFELDCKFANKKVYLQEIRFGFDLNLKPLKFNSPGDCRGKNEIIVVFTK